MRIVFFGTPAFALPSLRALASARHDIVSVVTQPDRPRGRGHHVAPSDVASAASELGLPVLKPARLRDPEFMRALAELGTDLGVVAAYGRILPPGLLAVPRLGLVNVHASLLPRWRGAAPVHRAILAGDTVTGVTIMRVVEALDAGPMLAKMPTEIASDETSESLEMRLAELGSLLLVETVSAIARGPVQEVPQDEMQVTYAAKLDRSESPVHWNRPCLAIHNQIRGLQPWPLATTALGRRRVLLRRSTPIPQEAHDETPGTIIRLESEALVVATAPGAIRLTELQLEGRPPMPTRAFLNGHAVRVGERFETPAPSGA